MNPVWMHDMLTVLGRGILWAEGREARVVRGVLEGERERERELVDDVSWAS